MYCLPGTRPGRQSFYFFSAQAVNSARLILLLSTLDFPWGVAERSESLGEAKNRNRKLSPFNGRLNSRTFGRMLSAPTGAMCKMFRPMAVYRLGTVTGLFIIQGVQVRRRRGIQSIIACRPSPGPGDRRSAPHRPSCGCAVPHRKVWQAYCRLHLEADMHRFLAIFALSIR